MECGTARIEITPPFPTALFGYPTDDRTYSPHKDKVLDPLQARAFYLQNGSGPGILLLVLDLCILLTPDAEAYRRELANDLCLPIENILISCTHTHSAPLARFSDDLDNLDSTRKFISDPEDTSLRYGKWIIGRLKKIAAMAVARKSPVSLAYRETCSGLGYNRRCLTPEGVVNCWNLKQYPERVPEPIPGLRHGVLNFDYKNKLGGVLIQNIGVHPVVMGKESHQISGDWPCYSRRHIEKRLGNYQAIFTQGAGGQVHPWISTQSDPKGLRWVGEAIGAEAVLMAATGDSVAYPEYTLQVDQLQIPETGINLSTLSIGRHLLVALPFELSTIWAEKIISVLNRPVTFICLCNGWEGYWMSPEEFEEGGYEIEVARSRGITPKHSLGLLEVLKRFSI